MMMLESNSAAIAGVITDGLDANASRQVESSVVIGFFHCSNGMADHYDSLRLDSPAGWPDYSSAQ
jgi:hypothetical protein